MSFLNSVLSSLNNGGSAISAPQYKPPAPKEGTANGERSSTPVNGKRKVEDQPGRPVDKLAKAAPGAPIARSPATMARKPTSTSTSGSALPAKSLYQKPSGLPSNSGAKKEPVAAIPMVSKAAPKKGSFAEILARAKQNQGTSVGTMTYKPKEKLSTKKELALQKELALKNKKGLVGRRMKGGLGGKTDGHALEKSRINKVSEGRVTKPRPQQGSNKSRNETTHQGTAKPKPQITYQGTMKASLKSKVDPARKRGYDSEPERAGSKSAVKNRQSRFSDAESAEEDDEEQDYDYASEDYSDMDAGFDDVEAEDEAATKAAKKEDAYEQMMLEELKRQKEQRKRRERDMLAREKERSRGR